MHNYTEKLFITIYVLFYNDNSKKYLKYRENQGAMVIILSGQDSFRSQDTKDSKNDTDRNLMVENTIFDGKLEPLEISAS